MGWEEGVSKAELRFRKQLREFICGYQPRPSHMVIAQALQAMAVVASCGWGCLDPKARANQEYRDPWGIK